MRLKCHYNTAQPCLIVRCGGGGVKDCHLVMEKKVTFQVKIEQSNLVLFHLLCF